MDANSQDEESRRRRQFQQWLLKVWTWADEESRPFASDLAELISHADELDYPLWRSARIRDLVGNGPQATEIQKRFGVPVMSGVATGWEREINYSPVITLEESVWRSIHGQLGWVNREHDTERPNTFWLWSNAANVVRFTMRGKEPMPSNDND